MAKPKPQPVTPDQKVAAFIRLLESGGHSRSTREKFSDFLELCYCAVAKPCAPTEERADELEARYMKIVGRYHADELDMIREVYPEMMGIMVSAVSFGGVDFLGRIAAELSALNAEQGQFFTPYEVSKAMAEISFDGFQDIIRQDGYITLSEPAAGAGGMVLAYADIVALSGFDLGTTMLVQAVDVSTTAYQMCYLQLAFRGVPAHVIRGNTLSLETFESAWTPAAVFRFLPQHGHLNFDKPETVDGTATPTAALYDVVAEAERLIEAVQVEEPTNEPQPKPTNFVQLALF